MYRAVEEEYEEEVEEDTPVDQYEDDEVDETLTDEEIFEVVRRHGGEAPPPRTPRGRLTRRAAAR